jgi:glycosyltransferase involved in cell wall biosynthesis
MRAEDWLLHIGDSQWVFEIPARAEFLALDSAAVADIAHAGGLGRPRAVHAHSTVTAVRHAAEMLRVTTGAPLVVTLHDVWFAQGDVDAFEREHRLRFVRSAQARLAPSAFIVEVARQALGEGAPSCWIDNGADPWPDTPLPVDVPSAPDDGVFAVAVVGAIGEPKGLTALIQVAEALPPRLRVVVLGYTERMLTSGWLVPGRLWVHGVFEPAQLPALVARYGARLAFFPPGVPESYSYALSDAWYAALPVLVPDHGALGERVRRHGGGDVYPLGLDLGALSRRVEAAVDHASPEQAAHAVRTLTTRRGMIDAMNDVYERLPGAEGVRAADESALRRTAQTHLDTHFFRPELLKLQRELRLAIDEIQRLEPLARERDVEFERAAALQARLDELNWRLSEQARQLDEQTRQLDEQKRQRDEQARKLDEQKRQLDDAGRELTALRGRYQALVGRLLRPIAWLPASWRGRVVRLGKHLLG